MSSARLPTTRQIVKDAHPRGLIVKMSTWQPQVRVKYPPKTATLNKLLLQGENTKPESGLNQDFKQKKPPADKLLLSMMVFDLVRMKGLEPHVEDTRS